MVVKARLIEHFLGEHVMVVTSSSQGVETGSGIMELPVAFEGVVVDFDDKFLMISPDTEAEKLIALTKIVSIEILKEVNPLDQLMNGPNDGPIN